MACGERADAESPRAIWGNVTSPRDREASSRPSRPSPAGRAAIAGHGLAQAASSLSTAATGAQVVLAAGGDVNLGRECGQAILQDPTYDPFAALGRAWTSADVRFVNLESQLSDQQGVTQSSVHRLIFTGPPEGAAVLARANVMLVSTANNHAWDYGKNALFETLANLERAGVQFAGTGRSPEQAYRPAVLTVNGLSIALFAVTQVWNQPPFAVHEGRDFVAWADVGKIEARIREARRQQDFVFVSYHGGEEYVDAPVERTRQFVRHVMALGVDAVIGHHPHVTQGVGWREGRPILFSLGNFVFAGHQSRPRTKRSFFARLTLRRGLPIELSLCPIVIEGHRPRALDLRRERPAFARARQRLIDTSASTGGSDVEAPDELGCLRVTPKRRNQPPAASSSN